MSEILNIEYKLDSSCIEKLIDDLTELETKDVVVNAESLTDIGAYASEIFFKFKSKMESDGGTVKFNFSPEMLDDLRLIGLDEMLTLDGER
jgi:hypothetical protein